MVEVWNSDDGYIVHKTAELETEVARILALWKASDSLPGYCPSEREQKLYEYNNQDFEIETVSEQTGVVFVALYRKEMAV